MSVWDFVNDALQKSQSIASGTALGTGRYFGLLPKNSQYQSGVSDPFEGAWAGLQGHIRPHDITNEFAQTSDYSGNKGLGWRLADLGLDFVADPINLLTLGAGKALQAPEVIKGLQGLKAGSEAAKAAEVAGEGAKLEEGVKTAAAAKAIEKARNVGAAAKTRVIGEEGLKGVEGLSKADLAKRIAYQSLQGGRGFENAGLGERAAVAAARFPRRYYQANLMNPAQDGKTKMNLETALLEVAGGQIAPALGSSLAKRGGQARNLAARAIGRAVGENLSEGAWPAGLTMSPAIKAGAPEVASALEATGPSFPSSRLFQGAGQGEQGDLLQMLAERQAQINPANPTQNTLFGAQAAPYEMPEGLANATPPPARPTFDAGQANQPGLFDEAMRNQRLYGGGGPQQSLFDPIGLQTGGTTGPVGNTPSPGNSSLLDLIAEHTGGTMDYPQFDFSNLPAGVTPGDFIKASYGKGLRGDDYLRALFQYLSGAA
jgi:hypothetical protein